MTKKLIVSIFIFIMLINNVVYALDFSNSAGIDIKGDKKYKAVRLDRDVYNHTKSNMADLILYDKDNEQVPYFLNSFIENGIEERKTYDMILINSFIKDEEYYYDYGLVKSLQNEDVTATSIVIGTERVDFAKEVEVLGSYDNVNWQKVKDDILYSVGGSEKLEISFVGIEKYTNYRFKIANNLERISFSSVGLKYNKVLQKKEYFTDTILPVFTVEEKDNTTVVKIADVKNLKLNSITIKTDSMFKREVAFGGISKMLYNLDFENTKYQDLSIPLEFEKVTSDTAEVVIYNKDDKPINILGVELKYIVDELVFEGSKEGEYTLKFGSSELNTPKSYDISNYKDQILNDGYDILRLKETKFVSIPSEEPKPQFNYKLIFNITISMVAFIMGIIVVMKLKK